MSLTVRELTQVPHLRTWIHAGASGADNVVTWAHSIEIPRQWEWLEPGDLLMTVGLGVPSEPAEQVDWVEQLAAVGVSGVAIGERMQAPPLSPAMLEAAERVGLPLLYTAYEVPFVQLSRAVAAAGERSEHDRLVRAARIYDRMRAAVGRDPARPELLSALEDEIRCELVVCANDTATVLVPGSSPTAPAVLDAFRDSIAGRAGTQPAILRLAVEGRPLLVVPVPARRPASLLARPLGEAPPFAILQHVATAAALEVERLLASREELRRLGSETFASLLDARITGEAALAQLRPHGLEAGPFAVLAGSRRGPLERAGEMHHLLAERGVPNLLLRRAEVLYVLMPAHPELLERVLALADEDFRIGVSRTVEDVEAVPDAAHEARWSVSTAHTRGKPVVRYGDEAPLFGPRSVEEARIAVDRVLGPALAYDADHGTELVPSLAAFLRCNRSWQRTTAELFVHKQTLVYRMRRVEELTGRRLNDTADVAELWLAVRALETVAG